MGTCSSVDWATSGGSVEHTSELSYPRGRGLGISTSLGMGWGCPTLLPGWQSGLQGRPQGVAGAGIWSLAGAHLQPSFQHLRPSRCSPSMLPIAPTTSTAPSGQASGHGSLRRWPSRLPHCAPHCRSTQPSATASGDPTLMLPHPVSHLQPLLTPPLVLTCYLTPVPNPILDPQSVLGPLQPQALRPLCLPTPYPPGAQRTRPSWPMQSSPS